MTTTKTNGQHKEKHVGTEKPPEAKPEVKRDTPFDAFMEAQRKAVVEAGKAIEALVPKAVKDHGEAALKESLEGYRQLVNSTIDEIVDAMEKSKIP